MAVAEAEENEGEEGLDEDEAEKENKKKSSKDQKDGHHKEHHHKLKKHKNTLEWVGEPILEEGKKKYYSAVTVNGEKVVLHKFHLAAELFKYQRIF